MIKSLVSSLHPLERKLMPFLKETNSFDELIKISGMQDIEIMRALQWLSNKKVLEIKEEIIDSIELDKNGLHYAKKGLPEKRFLKAILHETLKASDLMIKGSLSKDEINACIGLLKQKQAVDVKKDGNELTFTITDAGKKLLEHESAEDKLLKKFFPLKKEELTSDEKQAFETLLKRREIIKSEVKKKKTIELLPLGQDLVNAEEINKEVVDRITTKILKEKTWKDMEFRSYDVKINVPKITYGKRHFVNQSISYMKRIWTDLGFQEMEGAHIHTSFKDLDCLFVPQDHPARTMQDTFYIKNPKVGKLPEWYTKIKEVHEKGGDTGSTGWGGVWSKEIAEENLLRTHTTVLSAEYLKKIGEGKYKMPCKFFSVNKVYRNEALDWKHLFEFNQVEGIVVDPNANVSHLKGYLREFFGKMGYTDVRMRPAHFPYTEPSFEVDVYNPRRDTWVELGGAGIFRPEVTKPLIGSEVPVLAWGIGMERIITEYFQINDLRELYKNDLKQIRRMKTWMK